MSVTPWLKRPHPGKGPPAPASVNIETLWAKLEASRARGTQTPAETYLSIKAPALEFDAWGEPLPLSAMAQDYLDRVFAVLLSPFERGEALLHSGRLCPDEVEPISVVFPEVWATLVERATDDLFEAGGPPLPAWAETSLGILFQKPASAVYNPKPQDGASAGTAPTGKVKPPEPTQADRRELAVRG